MGVAGPARIIFAGSPDFAVPSLERLTASGQNVVAVLTRPDRPAGRGRQIRAGPVKTRACALGLEVLQPETLAGSAMQKQLLDLQPDLMVVVAYGLLLPGTVLAIPRAGCVNVHASLLPRWRGASPIQAAILAGDARTGVSLMHMDEGLDTGPVYATASTDIGPAETAGGLHDRLAMLGAELLAEKLDAIVDGRLRPAPQRADGECYAGRIGKSDGEIHWSRPATEILRMIRAYDPWPVAWTSLDGKNLRIRAADALAGAVAGESGEVAPGENIPEIIPGQIIDASGDGVAVQTGDGAIRITELQLEGRQRCAAHEFANGYPMLGKRLGR